MNLVAFQVMFDYCITDFFYSSHSFLTRCDVRDVSYVISFMTDDGCFVDFGYTVTFNIFLFCFLQCCHWNDCS